MTEEKIRRDFAMRLDLACKQKGLPEQGRGIHIAKVVGVTGKAVSKWFNAETMPTPANIYVLAKFLDVPPEWLTYGTDITKISATPESTIEQMGILLIPEFTTTRPENEGIQEHSAYHQDVPYFPIRKDLFEKLDVPKEYVVAIYINDPAMAPTIRKGAVALVDTRRKEFEEGGIIAWVRDRHVMVRRTIQKIDGWTLSADSPLQPTPMYPLSKDEIIGKVIWQSSAL